MSTFYPKVDTVIGAALGPLALLVIFAVLFAMQGRRRPFSLAHTDGLWQFSMLVSTVSFLAYVGLLRKRSPNSGP
jgi:steroid 5-alpha reductase family enzyme